MKVLVLVAMMSLSVGVLAEETVSEKVEAGANNVKRDLKKAGHRIEEAVCAEGDLKCAGKKAGHRIEEGADLVKDKVKEAAGKVDNKKK